MAWGRTLTVLLSPRIPIRPVVALRQPPSALRRNRKIRKLQSNRHTFPPTTPPGECTRRADSTDNNNDPLMSGQRSQITGNPSGQGNQSNSENGTDDEENNDGGQAQQGQLRQMQGTHPMTSFKGTDIK